MKPEFDALHHISAEIEDRVNKLYTASDLTLESKAYLRGEIVGLITAWRLASNSPLTDILNTLLNTMVRAQDKAILEAQCRYREHRHNIKRVKKTEIGIANESNRASTERYKQAKHK